MAQAARDIAAFDETAVAGAFVAVDSGGCPYFEA